MKISGRLVLKIQTHGHLKRIFYIRKVIRLVSCSLAVIRNPGYQAHYCEMWPIGSTPAKEYPPQSLSTNVISSKCMAYLSRAFIVKKCDFLITNCVLVDIMVCTGCCGTLDFIVTHLFKTLSKRRKKNLTGMDQQPPCLRILESHPEMIQQVCARDLERTRD